MENIQTTAEALARLEEPFASKEVKWLVAATSRDGRKGRVTPYADTRAYTDRLNQIFTASGWTRQYNVHTVSPLTRVKRDKTIQTGKVLVTCTVSISGVGTNSGTGEEWADDENAMTSAEAQAFKRACSLFGLGRYFYKFDEMWVGLNEFRQPKALPPLPSWALPPSERSNRPASETQGNATPSAQKGPMDASITGQIEGCRRSLGSMLYGSILGAIAKVRAARDIPNQRQQVEVLKWMESGVRGMAQIRQIASEIPEGLFFGILDRHKVQSLDQVPSFAVLKQLVEAMNQVRSSETEQSVA
jgi:hypothetical protein